MADAKKIVVKAGQKNALAVATVTIHATLLLDDSCIDINKSGLQEVADTISEEFGDQLISNNLDGVTLQSIDVEVKL
jgi:hypothetical protein